MTKKMKRIYNILIKSKENNNYLKSGELEFLYRMVCCHGLSVFSFVEAESEFLSE